MVIQMDANENFISFEYAKITCGKEINAKTGLNRYFVGQPLQKILETPFEQIDVGINPEDEEAQFVLYLEWDALRSAVALYLGSEVPGIDIDRCIISSVDHNEKGTEVVLVILPPKELPKILPCRLSEQ